MASIHDPCFFDPPPGSYSTVVVTNDTSSAVTLVECQDERCRSGYNEVTVQSGKAVDVLVEDCSGGTLAAAEPQTLTVVGCLVEPLGQAVGDAPRHTLKVSERRPCRGATGAAFRVRIVPPG